MWPFNGPHARRNGFVALGVVIPLFVLGLVPGWGIAAEIDFVGGALVAIAFLGVLSWQMVTGRIGLIHMQPTARRRRRLERRAAGRAELRP